MIQDFLLDVISLTLETFKPDVRLAVTVGAVVVFLALPLTRNTIVQFAGGALQLFRLLLDYLASCEARQDAARLVNLVVLTGQLTLRILHLLATPFALLPPSLCSLHPAIKPPQRRPGYETFSREMCSGIGREPGPDGNFRCRNRGKLIPGVHPLQRVYCRHHEKQGTARWRLKSEETKPW